MLQSPKAQAPDFMANQSGISHRPSLAQSLNNELLNNFFTASGKNNYYNTLNSIKTSPVYSPRPGSNQDNDLDFTFSKDNENFTSRRKDEMGQVESINSWDLEGDDIDEFQEAAN